MSFNRCRREQAADIARFRLMKTSEINAMRNWLLRG